MKSNSVLSTRPRGWLRSSERGAAPEPHRPVMRSGDASTVRGTQRVIPPHWFLTMSRLRLKRAPESRCPDAAVSDLAAQPRATGRCCHLTAGAAALSWVASLCATHDGAFELPSNSHSVLSTNLRGIQRAEMSAPDLFGCLAGSPGGRHRAGGALRAPTLGPR